MVNLENLESEKIRKKDYRKVKEIFGYQEKTADCYTTAILDVKVRFWHKAEVIIRGFCLFLTSALPP